MKVDVLIFSISATILIIVFAFWYSSNTKMDEMQAEIQENINSLKDPEELTVKKAIIKKEQKIFNYVHSGNSVKAEEVLENLLKKGWVIKDIEPLHHMEPHVFAAIILLEREVK